MLRAVDLTHMPIPREPLEKTAFLSALRAGIGKALSTARFTRPLAPYTRAAEKNVAGFAAKHLGADPSRAQGVVRGALQQGVRDAVSGAAVGGVLSGGLGAALAEPGERWSGFAQGALSGAAMGAGFGGIAGVGNRLVRNTQHLKMRDVAKTMGVPTTRAMRRAGGFGFRDTMRNAFTAPKANNPLGKLDQSLARTKVLGGLGFAGVEIGSNLLPVPGAGHVGASAPAEPAPQGPQYLPNQPAVYSQPQYYKTSAAETRLRTIDFKYLPSYHR